MGELSGTPDEILNLIAKNLGKKDLNSLGVVNKALNKVTAAITKWDTFQAEVKDAEILFKARKEINIALDELVEDRIAIKDSKKETSKSGNYKKLKANVDQTIVNRSKELKSLGEALRTKSAEFIAAWKDLQTKIKQHEKDSDTEFKKNVGMTPEQAETAQDWLYKVGSNFSQWSTQIATRYDKLSTLGKTIKKDLGD